LASDSSDHAIHGVANEYRRPSEKPMVYLCMTNFVKRTAFDSLRSNFLGLGTNGLNILWYLKQYSIAIAHLMVVVFLCSRVFAFTLTSWR
jgi:hypothetical protein